MNSDEEIGYKYRNDKMTETIMHFISLAWCSYKVWPEVNNKLKK